MLIGILLLTLLYLLFISVFVLLKAARNRVSVSLAVSLGFIALWLISVYGLTTDLGLNVTYGRLVFVLGMMSIAALFVFVMNLTKSLGAATFRGWVGVFSGITSVVMAALAMSSLLITQVIAGADDSLPTPRYGGLLVPYAVWVLTLAVLISTELIRGYMKAQGVARDQILIVARTIIAAVISAILTNLLLPLIAENNTSAFYAPVAAIILATGLSYSVARAQFLDIGSFVVRAALYMLTTVLLGLLYVLPLIFILSSVLHGELYISNIIISVLLLSFWAISYRFLIAQFQKLTKKIFFADAYDSGALLFAVNRSLVSVIDIDKLLSTSSRLISQSLHAGYCVFFVKAGDVSKDYDAYIYDAFRNGKVSCAKSQFADVIRLAAGVGTGVVLVHNKPTGDESTAVLALQAELKAVGAAAIIRMNGIAGENKVNGFMILGARNSGRPYVSADGEVLATIANTLVIALQGALRFEEIQQFNRTLQAKVDEATNALRRSNVKLKALDETKDEFISMASHQLRTPLTSVKGYLSMVLEGDAGELNDQQRQLLGQSYSSAQRMVYLISDLLNLSRLNTGKFVIEAMPLDLRDIVATEVEQLRETAKVHGVRIVYEPPATLPALMLDETKIHQVVMNFLDNAIYYTPSGGEVVVSLVETATAVEYRVKDSGIGVPRSEQHRLFSKFYRAENARRVRPDGTGLGLFMSKKVIVAQGGSIIFESEEGKGSTFGFRFSKAGHTVEAMKPNQ